MKGHTIITEHVYPPIPDRSMDWSAVFEDYDGGNVDYDTPSRDPIGRGPTELAAIADLLQQQLERDEPELVRTLIEIATGPYQCAAKGHVWAGSANGVTVLCDECGVVKP